MKKTFKILIVLAVACSFLLVPSAFIYQDFLHEILHKVLRIRIKSSFSGGDVEYGFRDTPGDNRGSGSLTLPLNPLFGAGKEKFFDLLYLNIHKPQLESDWSSDGFYWQFTYGLSEICGMEIISHYFGFRDVSSEDYPSSIETFPQRSEKVSFSPEYPWMYKVQIDGYNKKATLFDATGANLGEITLLVDSSRDLYIVRIPLKIKKIRTILRDMGSYHYVMIGIFNSMTIGNYNLVQEKKSMYNGGGAQSNSTPRIYDYIEPKNFFLADLEYSKLEPILAFKEFKEEINTRADPQVLYTIIEENRKKTDEQALTRKEIETKLVSDSDNPALLASLGALIAQEGGKTSSTKEAMELVYAAYELFDQAEQNIKNESQRLTLALNRGYVSMAVPESIFKKSKIGAEDFLFAADYYLRHNLDKYSIAEYYLNASYCYKEAQMFSKSETCVYMAVATLNEQ